MVVGSIPAVSSGKKEVTMKEKTKAYSEYLALTDKIFNLLLEEKSSTIDAVTAVGMTYCQLMGSIYSVNNDKSILDDALNVIKEYFDDISQPTSDDLKKA